MNTQDYLNKRNKVISIINKLSDSQLEKALHSLGLMFGEYRHLKTYENRKKAYQGNPVFDNDMRVLNLDFWASIELERYPALSELMKDTFKNAANEWYLKQFAD